MRELHVSNGKLIVYKIKQLRFIVTKFDRMKGYLARLEHGVNQWIPESAVPQITDATEKEAEEFAKLVRDGII